MDNTVEVVEAIEEHVVQDHTLYNLMEAPFQYDFIAYEEQDEERRPLKKNRS